MKCRVFLGQRRHFRVHLRAQRIQRCGLCVLGRLQVPCQCRHIRHTGRVGVFQSLDRRLKCRVFLGQRRHFRVHLRTPGDVCTQQSAVQFSPGADQRNTGRKALNRNRLHRRRSKRSEGVRSRKNALPLQNRVRSNGVQGRAASCGSRTHTNLDPSSRPRKQTGTPRKRGRKNPVLHRKGHFQHLADRGATGGSVFQGELKIVGTARQRTTVCQAALVGNRITRYIDHNRCRRSWSPRRRRCPKRGHQRKRKKSGRYNLAVTAHRFVRTKLPSTFCPSLH